MNVHRSAIHNSQKMKTLWIFTNGWIGGQIMIYTHNGIVFSHQKELSTDLCYNTDELWRHYVKWKKPDTKGHILYDSIYWYMKYLE